MHMRMHIRVAWGLFLALCSAVVLAQQPRDAVPTAADPALEARVHAIAVELRCLVCQNQTVADSSAPLAVDLKNQVRDQLRAGRSADDIRTYMTDRYGDFVLYKPPLKASTLVLWGGPVVLVLAGLVVLVLTLRRRDSQAPASTALSEADRQRAEALLRGPKAD